MTRIALCFLLVCLTLITSSSSLENSTDHARSTNSLEETVKTEALEAYGKLPLLFIENQGQTDKSVAYYLKTSGQTLYFTANSIIFDLTRFKEVDDTYPNDRKAERLVYSLDFLGASSDLVIEGKHKDSGRVNYFMGNDSDKWHTNIPTYHEVIYSNIYPNIDLRFYSKDGMLTYDFVVYSGGDLTDIRLAYSGVEKLSLRSGGLLVSTTLGDMHQSQPYIFQQIGNEVKEVDGSFRLINSNRYGFYVEEYNSNFPLIIDPSLVYSTFLGGTGTDQGYDIAVDASGFAYITGRTSSNDYPTFNSYQNDQGDWDTFVTKIDTTQTGAASLVYSTYLGGNDLDYGYSIAVDNTGFAYITGCTNSSNFPTLNQYQTDQGSWDAFITKLNGIGNNLVYSTYLGGSADDYGYGITIDAQGHAYITGYTESNNFPTLNQYQTDQGGQDAFITRIDTTQTGAASFVYSTYLGGSADDSGKGITIDESGRIYITGNTNSNNFPTLNQYQTDQGGWDAFVTKIDTTQTGAASLTYSTYLGGSARDLANSIAIDASDCAYITGHTTSTNFPTLNPYQGDQGGQDVFITKLTAKGNGLVYSTYLGGSGDRDYGLGIVVDIAGCAYTTGYTNSNNFPTLNPYQGDQAGEDAFITKLAITGNNLVYSTYLGGSDIDRALGIAIDTLNCAYVTGETSSGDFPTTTGAFATVLSGGVHDAFVAKLGDPDIPDITVNPAAIAFGRVNIGSTSTQAIAVTNNGQGNLSVGNITLGGADADQFSIQNDNCSGQALGPVGSATLQVVFNPTSTGNKIANLSISSNDPDENPVNVTLTGIGSVAPAPTPSAPSASPYLMPAKISAKYLNVSPQQTYAGQPVTISANMVNSGDRSGGYAATLKVNSNAEQTKIGIVDGHSAVPVTFTVIKTQPGTYTVDIGGQKGIFTILGTNTGGSPSSSGLIALIVMAVLILAAAMILMMSFRRSA
jgi:hypothetical protein